MLGNKFKKSTPLPLYTIRGKVNGTRKVVGKKKTWNLANSPLINDNSCFSDSFGHLHVCQCCHKKPALLPFAEVFWTIQTWAALEQGQFRDLLPATPPPPDSPSSPEAASLRRQLQLLLFPDSGGESRLGARSTVQGFHGRCWRRAAHRLSTSLTSAEHLDCSTHSPKVQPVLFCSWLGYSNQALGRPWWRWWPRPWLS